MCLVTSQTNSVSEGLRVSRFFPRHHRQQSSQALRAWWRLLCSYVAPGEDDVFHVTLRNVESFALGWTGHCIWVRSLANNRKSVGNWREPRGTRPLSRVNLQQLTLIYLFLWTCRMSTLPSTAIISRNALSAALTVVWGTAAAPPVLCGATVRGDNE